MPAQRSAFFRFSTRAFLLAVVILIVGLGFVVGVILPMVEAALVAWVFVLAVIIISALVYLILVSQAEVRALAAQNDRSNSLQIQATRSDFLLSSTRLWNIFCSAPEGMAFLNLDGCFLDVNPAFCRLLGYDENELVGQDSQLFVQPDDREAYKQALARSLTERSPTVSLEVHFRQRSGTTLWGHIHILLACQQASEPDCFVLQFSERSQENEMIEVLWQQILRNELILQTATDGLCVLDIQGNILETNVSFAAITGYTQDELLGMRLEDLEIELGERPLAEYLIVGQQQDNLRFQSHCKRKDGQVIDLAASLTFVDMGAVSYIFLSAADITAQRAAQVQVHESRQMLQLILDLIPTRVFWKDIDLRYVGYNRQWVKDTGLSDESVLGKTDYEIGWSQAARYQADDRTVITTGKPLYDIEEPQDRPDGSIGWLHTHKIPLLDTDGKVVGVLGSYEDITQQKLAEDRLRASEARLQAIFDNTAAGIVVIDPEGRYLQVNDFWCNLLGYSSAELLTMTFTEVTYDPDRDPSWQNINALLRQELAFYNQEKRYVCKDGRVFWAQLTVSGLPEPSGEVTALIAVISDITERKAMEEQLLQSEARYRTLFENMPVALQVEDFSGVKQIVDGLRSQGVTDLRLHFADNRADLVRCVEQIQVVDVNYKSLALYEVPNKGELIGPLSRHVPVAGYDSILDEIVALSEGLTYFSREYQDYTLAGKEKHLSVSLSVAPGYEDTWSRVLFSLTDITILKQTEAAEHEQRTLSEVFQDVIAALASSLDADEVQDRILENIGRVVPHDAANIGLIEGDVVRIDRWRGYPTEMNEFIEQVALPLTIPNYCQMVESGKPCLVSHTEQTKDWVQWPELSWIKSYISAPIKTHDQVIGFLNLDSNIPGFFTQEHAERLQAFADQVAIALENAELYAEIRRYADELEQRVADRTAELEHERAQLQAILEGVGDGVIYTEDWTVHYFNQQLLTLTGYSSAEIAEDLPDLINKVTPRELDLEDYFLKPIKRLTDQRIWRGTAPVKRADGSQFEASLSMTLISDPGVTPMAIVTMIRDISQEKALQDQKDQFIANASHELRTPLANMKMRLYLLHKQPVKADEHMRVLEIATAQMEALVENLLDLSRFERGAITLQRRDIVLQSLLDDVVVLQLPSIEQKELTLVQDVPPDPVHLAVDSGRITQVFTNLIANAINYTPEGGTLTLRVEPHDVYVLVHVVDTGLGIPAEAQNQIFEPFFRVNERYSPGTGLGLPISREIVMLHGGELTVISKEGEGSIFTVKLPCTLDE